MKNKKIVIIISSALAFATFLGSFIVSSKKTNIANETVVVDAEDFTLKESDVATRFDDDNLYSVNLEITKEGETVDSTGSEDASSSDDQSGGETPTPAPDPSTPLTIKNVIKAILKTFRDALYDLIDHIKGLFKR